MMLWDAANMVVDCLLLLSQEQYGFKDGHTFNVQFINCSPKWIDFGSITENIEECTWCLEEFRRNFIVPLWLTKYGGAWGRKIAYELIRECTNQDRTATGCAATQPQTGYILFSQSFLRVVPIRYYCKMKQFEKNVIGGKNSDAERFFRTLKTYVNALKPEDLQSEWVGHQSSEGDHRDILHDDTVVTILKEINPESVIEFRADDGFYSFAAENSGYKVISAEFEETPLNTIYKRAQAEKRRITPVKIDFLFPTSPCLIGLGFGSSFDRLNADVSLAVDFIDDAILRQYCSMDVFTEIISKYSNKASIIEFISPGDTAVKSGEIPREYSKENLIHEMNKRGFSLKKSITTDLAGIFYCLFAIKEHLPGGIFPGEPP